MKCIVTGAAGFVGFHLSKALLDLGFEVVGIDNLNAYYSPALKQARLSQVQDRKGFSFVEMDLADSDAVMALPHRDDVEVVVHLAAQAGVRNSLVNPFDYARANLLGHMSVLEFCRHAPKLDRLVYASSSSVYGEGLKPPYREDQVVNRPKSLYAATKAADELMSSSYASLFGLKQIGLRFFTVYGAWGRPDMAYWLFTERILRGDPIDVFNFGQMRRDFTYIDDIVGGVLATITRPFVMQESERPHTLYNIGNNRPVELLDMIAVLEQALGREATKTFHPMQPGDVVETCADITALNRDYGFTPTTRLEDGLPVFTDWYRSYHGLS